MRSERDDRGELWMRVVLALAAAYNLIWGALVVAFPLSFFHLAGLPEPTYPSIWQCVGMIVGVFGVGYAVAASRPLRHWPIVLVGLLGKILGPVGFVWAAVRGELPWGFGVTIITNDLVWWIPFALILRAAYREAVGIDGDGEEAGSSPLDAIGEATASTGESLAELSRRKPVLVVFLRHLGCTFCRQSLSDVAARRGDIEAGGVEIVLVHMSDEAQARPVLAQFGLGDVATISDPDLALYNAFGLDRGRPMQLFGPRVWARGIAAMFGGGHSIGRLMGNGLQMPGVFLLRDGMIVRAFRHRSAADRPDYVGVACAAGSGVA